jgi:hypothetical protein
MIAPPKPPANDEFEALIKEARKRQLRRRLLGAATIAIAAALGLGIYALTIDGRLGGTTGGSPRTAPRVCRSSQLSTSAEFSAAAGTTFLPVALKNTSSRACALPKGRPVVQILFRAKRLPIKQQLWSAPRDFGRPAGRMLSAGRTAYVELSWRDWCPHPATAPTTGNVRLLLRFRDGLRIAELESSPDVPGPALPACDEVADPPQAVGVSQLLRYG